MKKRKALTLVEVVISMALIGIVAIVFLSIFSTGNSNIFRSGKRTKDTFEIQEAVDAFIKDDTIKTKEGLESQIGRSLKDINVEIKSDQRATVNINGADRTVEGRTININYDGIEIKTFVPNEE